MNWKPIAETIRGNADVDCLVWVKPLGPGWDPYPEVVRPLPGGLDWIRSDGTVFTSDDVTHVAVITPPEV